jgi:dTDP-4-dehydrorhamnose 3,5-epimerase
MNHNHVPKIEGVELILATKFLDFRGFFAKFDGYQHLVSKPTYFAMSNSNEAGTIRGLHFQIEPFAEEKLVSCIRGKVFDVVIDLRPKSNTFGKWTCFTLDSLESVQVYLPKGVAHGFQTLEDNSLIVYTLTSSYSADHSFSINPVGELKAIWPLTPTLVSEKDSQGVSLASAQNIYSKSL